MGNKNSKSRAPATAAGVKETIATRARLRRKTSMR